MDYDTLQWEVTDKVGILTLNRPAKLNSFNLRMFEEIKEVLRQAENDGTTRAIVIKGSGTSFSAGGDMEFLKYLQEIEPANSLENALTDILDLGDQLYNLQIPTVVAVHGYCLGVGLSFALLGDIRLASENAVFGIEFIAMGIVPDMGLMYTLPRLIGPAKAKELVLTSRRIKAPEAERIGMINTIVPDAELEEKAFKTAVQMGELPSLAIKKAKKGLNQSITGQLKDMLNYESKAQAACLKSEDHREAVAAFLAKRKPEFKGN